MRSVGLAWVSKCPWRNLQNISAKKDFEKFLRSFPPAGLCLSNLGSSLRKRNTRLGQAASRPQVQVPVRHYLLSIFLSARNPFIPQRRERIDANVATPRDVARRKRHCDQDHRYAR